ncbi:phage holin family protein, partial [Elusimicrobiota bacterium]
DCHCFSEDKIMKAFVIKWLIVSVTLKVVDAIFTGIAIESWSVVMLSALILVALNYFIKPLILLITLPINIISFGLFTLFINGFMFYLVSKIVHGFTIVSFASAFFGALIFSIVNVILNLLVNPNNRFRAGFYSGMKYGQDMRKKYDDAIDVEDISKDDKKINSNRSED